MTILRIVGSSSKGNAYILECNNEILLIEAGIPFRPINKNISYKLGILLDALFPICTLTMLNIYRNFY